MVYLEIPAFRLGQDGPIHNVRNVNTIDYARSSYILENEALVAVFC